mmetsp:Transcript_108716/g.313932  ORF Transcript_108716/g.313932 Transcript_108716/m.313932 type:complete len:167 (+) Transcript_108716:121-621(+)
MRLRRRASLFGASLLLLIDFSAAQGGSAATTASGDAATTATLSKSIVETEKLRNSIGRVVKKSTEEVSTLKSLLTSNAKATKALNDLMLEMASVTSRMEKFSVAMEECRSELRQVEVREQGVLTPQEADDPLLGTTAFLQLQRHAHELHRQAAMLRRVNASALAAF